jgi:hypothetical protein
VLLEGYGMRAILSSWRIVDRQEPMETAPSAWSPDRATLPPLVDLDSEPDFPASPRLIPEIEWFMSSQLIFEDIS